MLRPRTAIMARALKAPNVPDDSTRRLVVKPYLRFVTKHRYRFQCAKRRRKQEHWRSAKSGIPGNGAFFTTGTEPIGQIVRPVAAIGALHRSSVDNRTCAA